MDPDNQLRTPPSRRRKSLTSFVQSAVRHHVPINDHGEHPFSVDVKRPVAPRRRQRASKYKVQQDWEVASGFYRVKEVGCSSDTEIQVYDDASDKFSDEEKGSGAGAAVMVGLEDEDDIEEADISLESPVVRLDSGGRCGRLMLSSTPLLPPTVDVSDRIDRFDSSSDGEEKSSMAFSLNRRSKRVRSLQEPGTSLPESTSAEPGTSLLESTSAMGVADESISSSSPETECFDESGGYSRIKTSEWLNQVVHDSVDISRSVLGDDSIYPGPPDSSKKKGSLQLTEGGLAERMLKLEQKEKAEVLSWQQRVKESPSSGELGAVRGVTVQVLSLHTCCSVVVATCRVLHVDSSSHRHGDLDMCDSSMPGENEEDSSYLPGQEVTVMFSQQTCEYLQLLAGHHVKIHPPWSSVTVLSHQVILGAHFSLHVGESPLPPLGYESSCEQAQDTAAVARSRWQQLGCKVLPKFPTKGLLPTCLFPVSNRDRQHEPSMSCGRPHGLGMDHQSSPSPNSLLGAMEHGSDGRLGDVHTTVVCVFRRKGRCDSRCRVNKATPTTWRWSLLVMDDCGCYAEVRMPVLRDAIPSWGILVEDSEGQRCIFSDLRLVKRHDPIREQHLFALLASMKYQSKECRNVCFCLDWGIVTQFKLNNDSDTIMSAPVGTEFNKLLQNVAGKKRIVTRITFDAKLNNFQSEVSEELEFGPLMYTNCGHYLTVTSTDAVFDEILNTCGPINSCVQEHSSDCHEVTHKVTIYLRPSFVTDGLDTIFTLYGELIQIKDVELNFIRGEAVSLAMDTFSLILPRNPSNIISRVYPKTCSKLVNVD